MYEITFNCDGKEKTIRLVCGDLTKETRPFDLVICSAYKGCYLPSRDSLIGSLFWDKNISVSLLSRDPQIDMRDHGFWLSRSIDSNFRRIGCIELLDLGYSSDPTPIVLQQKYSTMRYVLEQASLNHLGVSSIAMPLPGVGEQEIELSYMACVLIRQLEMALRTIDELDEINIYEIREERAKELASILKKLDQVKCDPPKVFISYCSKQSEEAEDIRSFIERNGYRCWMAPLSIPEGSSYLDEIPAALNNVNVVVLVLTPDAEASVWVTKEVSTALGARKEVIPFRRSFYQLGDKFAFMLTDVQVLTEPDLSAAYAHLLDLIKKIVDGGRGR